MDTVASQNTSLTIVYSTDYSRDRWIPRTNGQRRGKCFHLMTSSCKKTVSTLLWLRWRDSEKAKAFSCQKHLKFANWYFPLELYLLTCLFVCVSIHYYGISCRSRYFCNEVPSERIEPSMKSRYQPIDNTVRIITLATDVYIVLNRHSGYL